MNRTRILPRLAFWLSAGMSLLSVILRSLAFLLHYDREVGYFDSSAIPVLCRVLSVLAVLCPVLCGLLIPKNTLPVRTGGGRRELIALLPLCGFLLFLCLTLAGVGKLSIRFLIPLAVLSAGGAAYFLGVLMGWRRRDLLALVGFCPVLWGILVIAQTYTDPYNTMNSPVKLAVQFGALGLMLALCGELRYHLEHPAPRVYLAVQSMGMFFCLTASVPYLVASLAGVVDHPLYNLWSAVLLGLGIYFCGRRVQVLFLRQPEASSPAEAADAGTAWDSDTDPTPHTPDGGAET